MAVTPVGATKSSIIAPTPQGIPPYSTVGMKSFTNLIIITCVCGSALMITLGMAAVVMVLTFVMKRKRKQYTAQQQTR